MENESIKEKGTYLRMALALQNISVPQIIAEQVAETLESINQKGGDFNVHDAIAIQVKYEELAKKKRDEEYDKM